MRVFLSGTSFRPDYGGPAYSVARLASALAEAGVEVGVWAPDGSAADGSLLAGSAEVHRLGGAPWDALNAAGPVEVIHDNGLWLSHNHRLATIARHRGIARIVSTRGMLEPWAIRHKRLKKRFAWWLYQKRDLRSADVVHATSEVEASNLRALKLGLPVRAIPNGVDLPSLDGGEGDPSGVPSAAAGVRTALFMGRVYPVKGLPMLVEAWARVRPAGWRLAIAGADEGGHLAEVEAAVAKAGLDQQISFMGAIRADEKTTVYRSAELVVLPTLSESFGMVVAEGLAHAVPVLTTQAAPWPMLEKKGCGWWVEPTVDGVAGGLREATSLDAEALGRMGRAGRGMVAAEYSWERVATAVIEMYEEALAQRRRATRSQNRAR